MRRSTREGIQASVLLHLGAIGLVVLLGFLATFFEEEPPVVFELVDLGGATTVAEVIPRSAPVSEFNPEPQRLPPVAPLNVPRFDNLRPIPDLPEEVVVEPPPAAPAPTRQPVRETPPPPRPSAPRPAEPPPKRISFDQHRQQFGEPEVTRAATPRRSQPEVVISTNARDRLADFSAPSFNTAMQGLSSAQQDELSTYMDGLAARLKAAFEPLGTSGLVALVEFTIQSDGRLTPYRIKRSSGNQAFDRSVLSVFERLRRYQPPPDGKSRVLEFNFRSVD